MTGFNEQPYKYAPDQSTTMTFDNMFTRGVRRMKFNTASN